jgi:hypothetical protein
MSGTVDLLKYFLDMFDTLFCSYIIVIVDFGFRFEHSFYKINNNNNL